MKKIISIMAAGMLMLGMHIVKAQTLGDYRRMSADEKTQLVSDSLKATLNLSDDQYKQVRMLIANTIAQIAPIVQGNGDRMEKGHQIRTVLSDTQVKLKAILTPEQSVLFEDKKAKLIAYYRHKIANQPLLFNAPTE